MVKLMRGRRSEKGFTLIEMLIVAAIIGIILAIAVPNLLKARISANEANGRKAMQTLREGEGIFFEQDADNNGVRDYTNFIGDDPPALDGSLRCPDDAVIPGCTEPDALVDNSFVDAIPATGDGVTAVLADCTNSKAGYCVGWTGDVGGVPANSIAAAVWSDPPDPGSILQADFGWEASMTAAHKTGRRDYGVWGDGVIRCVATLEPSGASGVFSATRDGAGASQACD